tara:strand:- start:517 stop:1368 length:852 start_codon:yes stop_codon:yes gene_type:complete
MANRYWVRASSGNANTTAAWATSAGGSTGASVPVGGDKAFFTGDVTTDCTWDITTEITGVELGAAYSGTVTQSTAASFTYDLEVGTSASGNNGEWDADSSTLTVGRDTIVKATLTGGSANHSFGSLTIASGGTYIATSGTTKITGEAASGYCIQTTGTFTHNKGLVEIDAGARITEGQNGPYWDLLLSDPDTDFYTSETWEIYNNFDLVGDFDVQNNAHHITVHGNMTIGDGSTTTRYMNATAYTNNLTVGGTLHITNGATADLGTHGTVNVGGIRNTGGSIS